LNGKIVLDASFIQFRSEFTITEEPQLELTTDIDFSSAISLCVRPNQPEKVTSHRQVTSEIIAQGGVNNRFMKNYSYRISGYSYLLNQKNNEMCNDIFSN
jgi:microsomal triglyceride transfer protein large subunit